MTHILRWQVGVIVYLVYFLRALNTFVPVDGSGSISILLLLLFHSLIGTGYFFKTILGCYLVLVMMFDLFDFFLLHRTAKFVRCSQVVIIFLWWYHTYVVHAHYSLVFEWVWQHAVQRRVVPVARRVQDAGTCAPVLTALSVFALDRGPKRTWQVVLILLYCFLLYFALLLLYLLQNLNLLVSRFVFGDWAPSFTIDSIESVDIAQVYHKVLVATTIILIQEFLWLRPKRG
jgi:hypothetical protein